MTIQSSGEVVMDLQAGSTFAGYVIVDVIGRGSMGVVYHARDEQLGRDVALKVVAPHLADDSEFKKRFILEAKAAAQVEHPSVVPIYEFGEEDGAPFIVMRLIKGRDLAAVLEDRGTLPVGDAMRLLAPIAAGIDAGHAAGVVHRDVKPANILVPEDGSPAVLVDFGIGRVMQATRATQTGSWVGTVDYVAPEQIAGGVIDGAADEYGLCCVIIESISGVPPYRRENFLQTLFAHANDPIPPISVPGYDEGVFDDVFAKGLAKVPGDRYAKAMDLIEAVWAVAGTDAVPVVVAAAGATSDRGPTGTVISEKPAGPEVIEVNAPSAGVDGEAVSGSRGIRRHAKWAIPLAAIVVIGGVVAAVVASNQAPDVPPASPQAVAACETAKTKLREAVTKLQYAGDHDSSVRGEGDLSDQRQAIIDARLAVNDCVDESRAAPWPVSRTLALLDDAALAVQQFKTQPPRFVHVKFPTLADGTFYYPLIDDYGIDANVTWDAVNKGEKPCSGFADLATTVYSDGAGAQLRNPPGWRNVEIWCRAGRSEIDPPAYLLKRIPRPDIWVGASDALVAAANMKAIADDPAALVAN